MSTLVQIKRSTANTTPGSLLEGELAYSYVSNVMFIGDTANGVMNIGGQYYTNLIDNASAANGASTFMRRYANGRVQLAQGDILVAPTANSHIATKEYVDTVALGSVALDNLTDVTVVGVAADQNNRLLIGQANGQYVTTGVSGNVSLSNTGVFTIGADQVTNAMLVNDAVTVTAGAGLAGGGSVALGSTITLDVVAGDGIANTGDVIAVDSTVVRTSGTQTINGNKTFANTINFDQGINVTGNIYLNGNTTFINVATLNVTDPLIYLGSNNTINDTVDIGFVASKNSGALVTHTGLARDASDATWYLFDNLPDPGHESNIIDFANTTYALLRANLDAQSANVNALTVDNSLLVTGDATANTIKLTQNAIKNSDGNTLIHFNGADVRLPNTSGALDVYSGELRVQGTTFVQATGANVQVLGDLTVSGGDILSTATANLLNTTSTTINFGGGASTIKVGASGSTTTFAGDVNVDGGDLSGPSSFNLLNITTDIINFGGVANTINIGHALGGSTVNVKSNLVTANFSATSANIGSLTLTTPLGVGSGGTGKATLTSNGVFYANTTSSFAFATGTEGQILQISSGVPTFAMLDGGSF